MTPQRPVVSEERLADVIVHLKAVFKTYGNRNDTDAASALADYVALRRQLREAGEALHGGAQALSQMAYDMESRDIDKTEGLRQYAATLRALAASVSPTAKERA